MSTPARLDRKQLFRIQTECSFLRAEDAHVLMISKGRVTSMDPDRIVFDRLSGDWTKPGQAWKPLV